MSTSTSDLIQLRMKLVDGKVFVSGVDSGTKSVKGLGRATTETAEKQRYAERTSSRLTGSYKKLGEAAKWGLGFLGVGGVLAIESSIHATENLAMSTSGLTRSFGLSTEAASSWAAVMSSRGVDPKALTMTFGSLSTKMTEAARKGGTLLTPFHQLGISQEEVAKGADNFQWGIMRVAKALGEEEGGAKRSTAAKALLGRGFSTLLPLMAEGSAGLHENLKAASEYGAVLDNVSEEDVMGMVQAHRELQLGMLGVQIQMTKALMPAMEMGEDQMEKFFKTLNNPNLTGEQKLERISGQFDKLQGVVVNAIEQALPTIAEHAGHLGVVMAGAVVHGFTHSNLIGKVAIAAWVFHTLGGESLVKAGAMKVGGMIGTEVGLGIATGAVGAFVAYEIWSHMSAGTKFGIERWVNQAGEDFVNGLIHIINGGIREINKAFDDANVFSFLGVSAPQIGEIGGVEFGQKITEQETAAAVKEGLAEGPGGKWVKPKTQAELEAGRHHKRHRATQDAGAAQSRRVRPRSELLLSPRGHTGSGAPIVHVTHTHIHVGSKEVAEAVTKEALDAAALA